MSAWLVICVLVAALPAQAFAQMEEGCPPPTQMTTSAPTAEPTLEGTNTLTVEPTPEATGAPTVEPTPETTSAPTVEPTPGETSTPTMEPVASASPSPLAVDPAQASAPALLMTALESMPMARAPRAAGVTLAVEASREGTAIEGSAISYTITLTNAGDSATEQLSVNIGVPEELKNINIITQDGSIESLDSASKIWTVLPLEPGETATLELSATVLSVETGKTVTVTASIPDGPADSASLTGVGGCRLEDSLGYRLIITGSVNLDDVTGYSYDKILVEATGTITGGTFNGSVDNYGTITGGTFNESLSNFNSGRIQGRDANALTINGAIHNEGSILQPCNYGASASLTNNRGAIQVVMLVNGQEQICNVGDKVSESLGGGTWCLLNEDSFSVCDADATFGFQTRSYVKLSAPNVTLDYAAETVTVTVPDSLKGLTAEDEVYWVFHLDIMNVWEEWNDIFANSDSYTNTLANLNSFNQMFGGGPLPRDAGDGDVEIPIWYGCGTRNGEAYPGAEITLTVPDRPECGRVEPLALITGDDRLGIDEALRATYDFGLAPAGDPAPDEPTILDEDGDGLITGLDKGEEYIVYLRLKATSSSFRSAWQEQGSAIAVKTYTVTYTDGVDGEEIFADQATGGLLIGAATPAFSGTPVRTGYAFAGWNPAVAATVSGNAVYTAMWKKLDAGQQTGGGQTGSEQQAHEESAGTPQNEPQENRLVVDADGKTMPYTYHTVETLDEATGAVLARTLVIVADPVKDGNGATVYAEDGQPLYEQRNLLLSRAVLDAIAARGYTHIRFVVKHAALEWPLVSVPGDGYVVRLAPLEADEWNRRETAAVENLPVLSQGYRARITAMVDGGETDVTKDIPDLKALLWGEAVSPAPEGTAVNLLLVPRDEQAEAGASPAGWVEATGAEPARYEAPLADSGLFAMVG
ncbi:MAG TPA: hypothetical protein IAA84_08825 [Candidatus Alectryocaccomicrobium excrementavium]|uniref:DUF11 domain-containing protein n=1 Tax=Candidatus Alectryocaccomicrobium excrementavium TaxID=2840668 RepID=A0A9D1K690_9FIRM|nr:hypothetical protein [Candidatus Alectryocaccomicrobium excrementavium]